SRSVSLVADGRFARPDRVGPRASLRPTDPVATGKRGWPRAEILHSMIAFLRQRRVRRRIARLTRELRTLDRERTPLAVARICHDLAQLSLAEGQRAEAVRWFGQSVDAYIYAGF